MNRLLKYISLTTLLAVPTLANADTISGIVGSEEYRKSEVILKEGSNDPINISKPHYIFELNTEKGKFYLEVIEKSRFGRIPPTLESVNFAVNRGDSIRAWIPYTSRNIVPGDIITVCSEDITILKDNTE